MQNRGSYNKEQDDKNKDSLAPDFNGEQIEADSAIQADQIDQFKNKRGSLGASSGSPKFLRGKENQRVAVEAEKEPHNTASNPMSLSQEATLQSRQDAPRSSSMAINDSTPSMPTDVYTNMNAGTTIRDTMVFNSFPLVSAFSQPVPFPQPKVPTQNVSLTNITTSNLSDMNIADESVGNDPSQLQQAPSWYERRESVDFRAALTEQHQNLYLPQQVTQAFQLHEVLERHQQNNAVAQSITNNEAIKTNDVASRRGSMENQDQKFQQSPRFARRNSKTEERRNSISLRNPASTPSEFPLERRGSFTLETVTLPSVEKQELAHTHDLLPDEQQIKRKNSKDDSFLSANFAENKIKQPEQIDVVGCFSDYMVKQGYTPLIHRPIQNRDYLAKQGFSPVCDGITKKTDKEGEGWGTRLFGKDKKVYALWVSHMFQAELKVATNEKLNRIQNGLPALPEEIMQEVISKRLSLRELRNGSFIWVVMLVEGPDGEWKSELRVISHGQGNHHGVVNKEEQEAINKFKEHAKDGKVCILAGGEGYKLDSKGGIIMINNKTGNYFKLFQQVREMSIANLLKEQEGKVENLSHAVAFNPSELQKALAKLYFGAYIAPEYEDNYFFDATKCRGDVNEEICKELIERGLGKKQLPDDFKEAYEKMPPDLKEKAERQSLGATAAPNATGTNTRMDGKHQATPVNNNSPSLAQPTAPIPGYQQQNMFADTEVKSTNGASNAAQNNPMKGPSADFS